jgi:hypothetical protein
MGYLLLGLHSLCSRYRIDLFILQIAGLTNLVEAASEILSYILIRKDSSALRAVKESSEFP